MIEVFNNIEQVAGKPANAQIVVRLKWDKSESPVAYYDVDDTMIRDYFGTATDEYGKWTANLRPNGLITPEGSVYEVTELIRRSGESTVYYFSIPTPSDPDDSGPVWVGSLLVDRPSWVG